MSGRGQIWIKSEHDPVFQITRIQFMDEGPGIPVSERNKLFLPYYTTKGRGSGLGLAICNRIISDHNGYIRVKDNYPQGTRFIIELPVKV